MKLGALVYENSPPMYEAFLSDIKQIPFINVSGYYYEMIVKKGIQDALRVSINEDGTFDVIDFTLPSLSGRIEKNVPQACVDKWVMEAVSMLRITNEGMYVKEIGLKVSDSLYYIKRKRD
jgi:hypothetical protein